MTDGPLIPDAERAIPSPATSALLDEVKKLRISLVTEIRQLGEQRGEQPGMFHIWPQGVVTTQRIRVEKLFVACLVANITLALRVGGSTLITIRQNQGTDQYDIPRIIQQGQNIDLIDVATGAAPLVTDLADAWLVGFTE